MTEAQTVETLFDCIRVFKDFAYTPWPFEEDFKYLDIARNTFLQIYALNKWSLQVTTHFILNHGFEFLEKDHTAYYTLQESIEYHNSTVKEFARKIFLNQSMSYFGYNRNENLYQRLRVKQKLSFLRIPSNSDPIQKWTEAKIHPPIQPPKNLQLFKFSRWLDFLK